MSKIVINRIPGYANKFRKIKLFVDNKEIVEIKDGQSKTIELVPGKFKLIAKIDWCQSNGVEFSLAENETKVFNLKGTNPFLSLYYIIFKNNKYLKLETEK